MAEIQITGLKELRSKLKALEDTANSRQVKNALMDAADYVATRVRQKVPHRSGRAAASVAAFAQLNRAGVKGGGSVPYYGWLDFGSRRPVYGNPRSVGPWSGSGTGPARGRYIFPTVDEQSDRIVEMTANGLEQVIRDAGLA